MSGGISCVGERRALSKLSEGIMKGTDIIGAGERIEKHEVEVGIGVFGSHPSVPTEHLPSGRGGLTNKVLRFKDISRQRSPRVWNLYLMTGALVGTIRWVKEREKYVFEPEGWTVFDSEMLEEINAVMKNHKLLS